MKRTAQSLFLLLALLPAVDAAAQTVDLADPAGRQIVNGSVAGGRSGAWLDVGDLNGDVNNKDLIVGSPDAASSRGEVRILHGWVDRTGTFSLDNFHVVITGAAAGDRFGTATNAGYVLTRETRPWPTTSRDLVVGAPAALGGRGEIYLFAGPVPGPSLTPSNAVIRIQGAAGDQLGTALETADLNNDGYREIVAGAPGNNRVYIIDYHNFPAASRDLSTAQPGVTTVTGAGIGTSFAAGDITADTIFDLAIGAPGASGGAGAVYVINGRNAALPTALALPAGANSTFAGLEAGDNTGSALWIRDVDGDMQWDLVITAPEADGPGNTRPNAGEAYVVFGRASQPAALAANATIFGAAAGHRLGFRVWIGSITRDTPDDVALLARGANNGFGEVYVVYGRHRSQFPAQLDLATTVDRRIVSDETQGPIERVVIFGVTAEGAEDLVLGVPAANAGTGRVYFSLSPTLQAEPAGGATAGGGDLTVNLVVNPGQTWTTPIFLKNIANIPVSWEVGSNRPWLMVTPTTGTSTLSQDGVFHVVVSSSGLSDGLYNGLARVFTTTSHLDTTVGVTVNMRVAVANREAGDFSGDGAMDLLWQHGDGRLALWQMTGTAMRSASSLSPDLVADTNWKIVGSGDFNNDGHPDVLWHHQTSGALAVWTMNGANRVSALSVTPDRVGDVNWRPMATGDFNGDGKRDIVWRHLTQGTIGIWFMDGVRLITALNPTIERVVDANWRIVGAGDFNRDGRADLVWRHYSTGKLAIWLMDGVRVLSAVEMTPNLVADTNWEIRAVGDANRDGRPDLIWQHATSGALAIWFMDGTRMISAQSITPGTVADLNWKIAGPR